MIKLTKLSNDQYSVNLSNGKFIGYFERDVDGYFYWWPDLKEKDGCWSYQNIIEIAEKLKSLNMPYEKELDKYFESISKCCQNHLDNKEGSSRPKDAASEASQ